MTFVPIITYKDFYDVPRAFIADEQSRPPKAAEMTIDGNIHNGVASLALIALLAISVVWTAIRFGGVKSEHLRDPTQSLFMPPWKVWDDDTWTEEGRAFQRAYRQFAFRWLVVLIVVFLLLDAWF
jgi:hypothetical protein